MPLLIIALLIIAYLDTVTESSDGMKSHWIHSGDSRDTAAEIFSRVGCSPNLKLYSRNLLGLFQTMDIYCVLTLTMLIPFILNLEQYAIRIKIQTEYHDSMVTEMPMDPSKYGL